MRLVFDNRYHMLAARAPRHLYLAPSPALRPFVAHYTLCIGDAPPAAGTFRPLFLVPDVSGCLVFSLAGGGLEGLLYGPSTRLIAVDNDLDSCPFRFFVEFRPGGLAAFTGLSQRELADRVLPLDEAAPRLCHAAARCWEREADLDGFTAAMDQALSALCRGDAGLPRLLGALTRSAPARPVSDLALELGYSQRQLARILLAGAGVSPKGFLRVLRINTAVRLLGGSDRPPLARLAQDLGYFDQSHFIHDFRAICGCSPTGYLARMSDFYNEPLKF